MASGLPDKWVKGIASGEPVPLVAGQILRDRLDAVMLLFRLAARNEQDDPEYIHLLRVWTRRAVTALKLFRDFLPPLATSKAIKRLNQIREVANAARDCDVLILRLEKQIGTGQSDGAAEKVSLPKHRSKSRWLQTTIRERAACQKRIIRLYQKLTREDRLDAEFQTLLDECCDLHRFAKDRFQVMFEPWAHQRLVTMARDYLREFPSDTMNLDELHEFRIRSKKFRYALELTAFALPPEMMDKVYQELTRLQDRLGHVNDLANGCQRLSAKRKQAKHKSDRRDWVKLQRKNARQLKQALQKCQVHLSRDVFREFKQRLKNLTTNQT